MPSPLNNTTFQMTDHFMFCRLVMFFSPFMHRSKDFKGIFSQGKSGCQWSYRLLQKYQGWVERFKGTKWIFGWRGDPLCRPRLLFFPSWVASMLGWDGIYFGLYYFKSFMKRLLCLCIHLSKVWPSEFSDSLRSASRGGRGAVFSQVAKLSL